MEFSSRKKVNGDRLPIYLYPTFLRLYFTPVFCRFFLNQNKHEVSILRCLCGSHSVYHQTFSAGLGGSLKQILYTFSSNFRPIFGADQYDFKLFYHLNEKKISISFTCICLMELTIEQKNRTITFGQP